MKLHHAILFLIAALLASGCSSCGPFWREDGPYYKSGIITGWEDMYIAERKDTICDHCDKWTTYSGSLTSYKSISLQAYLGSSHVADASTERQCPGGFFFAPALACDPETFLVIGNPIKKIEVTSRPSYSIRSGDKENISSRFVMFYSHQETYFPDFPIEELDTLYGGTGLSFQLLTPPADTNKFVFSFVGTLADNTEFVFDTDTLHLY